jgi:hypothetical protein
MLDALAGFLVVVLVGMGHCSLKNVRLKQFYANACLYAME